MISQWFPIGTGEGPVGCTDDGFQKKAPLAVRASGAGVLLPG